MHVIRRLGLLALLAACGDDTKSNFDAGIARELVALPTTIVSNLDLLVVLGADLDTHEEFAKKAYPEIVAQIELAGGTAPHLRLGVATADLGTSAKNGSPAPAIGPDGVAGCAADGDAGRIAMGSAPDVFLVGEGCAYRQSLAAMRAAFANPANAGFHRPYAALGVVVVTDVEDCSALDPSLFSQDTTTLGPLNHFRCTQFGVTCDQHDMTTAGPRTNCVPNHASTVLEDPADFIQGLREQVTDQRRFAFSAVIAPPPLEIRSTTNINSMPVSASTQTCAAATGVFAEPSIRLSWFAQQFGDRGATGTICDSSAAGLAAGINLRRAMGDPCIEEDVDLSHCDVSEEVDGSATPVIPCVSATQTDCYELATDPAVCPNAAHRELVIRRSAAAPDGYDVLTCR